MFTVSLLLVSEVKLIGTNDTCETGIPSPGNCLIITPPESAPSGQFWGIYALIGGVRVKQLKGLWKECWLRYLSRPSLTVIFASGKCRDHGKMDYLKRHLLQKIHLDSLGKLRRLKSGSSINNLLTVN